LYDGKVNDEVSARILSDLNQDGIALTNVNELYGDGYALLLSDCCDHRMVDANLVSTSTVECLNEYDILESVIFNKRLIDLANHYLKQISRYLGCYFEQIDTSITNSDIEVTVNVKGSTLFHRDGDDRKVLKQFIYLNDVGSNDGPFEYIKGTHHKGPFRDIASVLAEGGPFAKPRPDRLESVVELFRPVLEQKVISCEGEAGTIILADTSGIHRGGRCRNHGRRQMFVQVFATNAGFFAQTPFKIRKPCSSLEDEINNLVFGVK